MLLKRHLHHSERSKHRYPRQKSKYYHSLRETVCLQRKAATLEDETVAWTNNSVSTNERVSGGMESISIKPILVEHLENLITEFDPYIPDRNLAFQLWVRNPFLAKFVNLSKNIAEMQEELLDLHPDEFHRQLLSTASLGEFWTSVKKEKPTIGNE